MNHAEDWKRDFCEVFFAQHKMIAWTTVLVTLCAVAIAFLLPPTYQATSSVLVRGKRPEVSPGALEITDIRSMPVSREDVASEIEILKSPELVERTVAYLREHPPPAPDNADVTMAERMRTRIQSWTGFAAPRDLPQETEVRQVRDHLNIEVVLHSKVVRIKLRDRSKHRAESLLDTLLSQYISYRSMVFNPADQQRFFDDRCVEYRERLEALENRITETARQSSVTLPEQEMTNNMELKRDLTSRLSLLRDEYVSSSFLTDHTLEARLALLQTTIQELEARNVELQRHAIVAARITREKELIENSYETLSRRGEEAKINSDIAKANLSADVTILSRAALTAERVFPNKPLTLLLGFVIGFVLGCILAFSVNFLDHTFRSPIQVARYAGLPVICSFKKL